MTASLPGCPATGLLAHRFHWDIWASRQTSPMPWPYLASPQYGYVTGQELHVNGGMYM